MRGGTSTNMTALRQFWAELRRRRVIRVLIWYVIAGWAVIQVAATILPSLHVPQWSVTVVIVLVALGLPVARGSGSWPGSAKTQGSSSW